MSIATTAPSAPLWTTYEPASWCNITQNNNSFMRTSSSAKFANKCYHFINIHWPIRMDIAALVLGVIGTIGHIIAPIIIAIAWAITHLRKSVCCRSFCCLGSEVDVEADPNK